MNYKRSLLIGFVLILASFVLTAWLYHRVPDPKVAFMMPAIMAVVWLLLLVLPRVSPHGFRMDQFLDVFGVVIAGLIVVMSFLTTITLLDAAGYVLPVMAMILVATGMLMAFLGNYMGKLRKNFFIGVRTPWTLASDEVWGRTHRFAGWLFAAAGLVIATDGVLGANIPLFLAVLACAVLAPMVYSYIIYRRIEGFGPDPST